MRCDEVSRELSAPSGRLDPSAVSAHLEDCTVCAEWASRVRQLDTLWDATRPAEPAPAAFEAVWSGVSTRIEEPVVIPMPSRLAFGRRLALGLISSAAACLALALWMGRHQEAGPRPDPAPLVAQNPAAPDSSQADDRALALCDLEQGPTPIIHLSGDAVTVESQPLSNVSDTVTVAAEFDIVNYFETLGL